jgi:hypothetical protein
MLIDYWKKSSVTEADHSAYHATGWLPGGLESFIPVVEFPTVDNTILVCFESHLVTGLAFLLASFSSLF